MTYLNATGSNAGSSCAINLRLELANEGHRADKFLTRICESTVVAKVCLKQKSRRQIRLKGLLINYSMVPYEYRTPEYWTVWVSGNQMVKSRDLEDHWITGHFGP